MPLNVPLRVQNERRRRAERHGDADAGGRVRAARRAQRVGGDERSRRRDAREARARARRPEAKRGAAARTGRARGAARAPCARRPHALRAAHSVSVLRFSFGFYGRSGGALGFSVGRSRERERRPRGTRTQ